jgi:hypothetical protein
MPPSIVDGDPSHEEMRSISEEDGALMSFNYLSRSANIEYYITLNFFALSNTKAKSLKVSPNDAFCMNTNKWATFL